MITREKEPANLEMPFAELEGRITPTEKFYVRSHFPTPASDLKRWRLTVDGSVKKPAKFTLRDLQKLETRTIEATMECAGNSRIFLKPKVKGVQWELGAVGNAKWTGVPLSVVLAEAGLAPETREVILEGADSGHVADPPKPAGIIPYARSLPRAKALDDVLLAWAMNGEPLPESHGFPLRAVVPGWYGMAAVKWLRRITATCDRFDGYYQTVDYAYWREEKNGPVLLPLSEMQVKAQIARPENGESLSPNKKYTVRGASWTGAKEIARVEVSADDGRSWHEAQLSGKAMPYSWRLWEYVWKTPKSAGSRILRARASDSSGAVQPENHDKNRGGYMINHCLPVEVQIR